VPRIHEIALAHLRSHRDAVLRHAKGLVFWGLLFGACAVVAAVYGVILATHLLALWLGTGWALAAIMATGLVGCLLAFVMIRSEKRRLVAAHRRHLAEEAQAARVVAAELAAGAPLASGLAATAAAIAAVILLILRRMGVDMPGDRPGKGEGPPPAA
jgi:flagellar motor component MotA